MEINTPERQIDDPATSSGIPQAAFLPDGKQIITSTGAVIRIWDSESG